MNKMDKIIKKEKGGGRLKMDGTAARPTLEVPQPRDEIIENVWQFIVQE